MYKPIEEVLKTLQDGNNRFIEDKEKNYNFIKTRKRLIKNQNPFAIILGCSDSRVSPEITFDCNLGDLFIIQIAGNIVNEDILESIQYAINEFSCSTIIILGHENCGAVQMTLDGIKNNITQKIKKIINKELKIDDIINKNIQQSVEEVKEYIKSSKNITIKGAKYFLKTGEVKFL